MLMEPALRGFAIGASLIVAIGAQNAFILERGLVRSHVFALCLICAVSDALLIAAGVAGLGTIIASRPALILAVTLAIRSCGRSATGSASSRSMISCASASAKPCS